MTRHLTVVGAATLAGQTIRNTQLNSFCPCVVTKAQASTGRSHLGLRGKPGRHRLASALARRCTMFLAVALHADVEALAARETVLSL